MAFSEIHVHERIRGESLGMFHEKLENFIPISILYS